MLDIKLFLNDFDRITNSLQRKKVDISQLEALKNIIQLYKTSKQDLELLQSIQNQKSKLFGEYKRDGKDIESLKSELDENKSKISDLNESVNILSQDLDNMLMVLPNLPDDDVPDGEDENSNLLIKNVLTPREFDFVPKEHFEFSWIDFERGVKLSKSRFSVLNNEASRLERALINYMLDFNSARGFQEVSVPFIVNRETMTGTGQLPKFEDDLFKVGDDMFLIPTAEVPLTNLYADEIIDTLPIKLTSLTPCFRKEAGSAGRDTKGMIRQHQFYKVELVSITKPEDSYEMLEFMVSCASDMLTSLGLPHRLMRLCSGDLGFSAATTIDIEVWLPGQNRYREISSISNTREFQARRAKIRYRDGKNNRLVHTLNGSSLAVGRTMIAIMENYQNSDGSITIPEVLKKYMDR